MNNLASTITAMTITVGLLTGTARAEHSQGVEELSLSLVRQTVAASREVRYGFRHTPQFRQLYRDVCNMYFAAKHAYDAAQFADSRKHIIKDVQELDKLVHHAQELIDEMSGPETRHTVYGRHGYSYGAPSQYHLRRLIGLMDGIVATVHELQDVVGCSRPCAPVLQGPSAGVPSVIPPSPVVVPRSPVGQFGGFEFRRRRTGGLSFSLRIR